MIEMAELRTDRVYVVGIGDDGPESLSRRALAVVAAAEVLGGGERHLAFFPDHPAERIVVRSPLGEVAERLRLGIGRRRQVVLASGDPNFFGIAGYLAQKLGRDALEVIPNVSSVQLAFARLRTAWHDAALLSAHGRPASDLADAVRRAGKAAILTDDEHTPAELAQRLLQEGLRGYQAHVCENLGGADERIVSCPLEDLPGRSFAPLNVLVLIREGDGRCGDAGTPHWGLGIPDDEFHQRKPKRGLITKAEVRVVSLAALGLRPDSVVWDIGAGTGSVAIEAAGLAPRGRVFAVEKNAEDVENIRLNAAKFGRAVEVLHARAPDGLDGWPDPDAVFIGGSGGELEELLDVCAARLRPGGRIVVNAATIETLHRACDGLRRRGFGVDVTLLQVSRSAPILDMTRFEAFDPVYVIRGAREAPAAPATGEAHDAGRSRFGAVGGGER